MKKMILIPVLFLYGVFAYGQTESPAFNEVYRWITEKDYFRAAAMFEPVKEELSETERLVAGAFLDNAFNRLESSQQQIDRLLGKWDGTKVGERSLPDSLVMELYAIQEGNAVKMYDYAKARDAALVQWERFGHLMDVPEKENAENNLKLWSALAAVPPQRVLIDGHTVLDLKKDMAGLDNITVSAGGDTLGFVFDTGANLSTTCRSVAESMGMDMIPVQILVRSITGVKVPTRLAVCREMHVGHVRVENVVFLVLPDEELTFPHAGYKIQGIIGYPVIEAFGEIHITREGRIVIPAEQTAFSGPSNMAMNGLTPMICLDGKPFTFDTGADNTMLYAAYYMEHRDRIERDHTPEKIKFGGAGGLIELDGYVIDTSFEISGKKVELTKVHLVRDKIKESETVYGNIGQDLIGQFDKMVLNFERMFILLE